MKTQMPLVPESSPLQWSAAKKIKIDELAKENEEKENATSSQVTEKEGYVVVLVVVGGLDIKPIKTEYTRQQDDEELQGAVEDVANQEMPNYIVGLDCNWPI